MRVALLSYNAQAQDAVGNQIAEKADLFRERGADVRVFIQSAARLHPRLHGYSQEVRQVERTGPVWDYLASADLVVAVYAQFYKLLHFLPLLVGGKPRLLLHYHGVTPPELWHTPGHEPLEQGRRQRGLVWCVDQALTDSQFARQELIAATGFPEHRVASLSLPVDRARFHPAPHDRFLHERLGLDPAARLLLYVGRLAGNKRVPLLVQALARLREETPALHAVIVGDTSDAYATEAARCRALAEELHVSARLHLVGRLNDEELPRAYRSADLLVIPSLHEGFCLPVLEAMAAGLPVVASRAAALPETVGAAGLTFAPDEAEDLVRQVRRVLAPSPDPCSRIPNPCFRVAVVSFRFGPDIVGGAETSLRTLARALQATGQQVEVFTTCTRSESRWRDELPAGTVTIEGLPVHRFPIDRHERAPHAEVVAAILAADGRVAPEIEQRYLEHSLHSTPLVETLRQRQDEFDAIVVGPYLFGLTYDVAQALPAKTLLVPCFHDEAIARLRVWPLVYGRVGGILYHSPEEQDYAQAVLGMNHPNSCEMGTLLDLDTGELPAPAPSARPYVVYCGRYSAQKGVPELLEWGARYQSDYPERFDFVFMGQGEVALPRATWLHDRGRLEEPAKRATLAGARALVQLSRQESLSLVALEAWAQRTPIVVHRQCAVLAAQARRAEGGVAVDDYDSFAATLNDLWDKPDAWRARGERGQAYVAARYGARAAYVDRVLAAVAQLRVPMAEQMCQRGLERAARGDRDAWRAAFGRLMDGLMEAPPRPFREDIGIQACQPECRVARGGPALVPLRLFNWGSHLAAAEGPGRTLVFYEIREVQQGRVVVPPQSAELSGMLAPGQTQTTILTLTVPAPPGRYRLAIWTAREMASCEAPAACLHLPLTVEAGSAAAPVMSLLGELQRTLPEAKRLQKLPDEYEDVCEGRLSGVKRLVKKKLLNNFKQAYVDVLSRQQSRVNGHLIAAIEQLGECWAALDHNVRGIQQRLETLEKKLAGLVVEEVAPSARADATRTPPCRSS
jgi:O-antigen biosynthesis protein